jgi:hypothetical protein
MPGACTLNPITANAYTESGGSADTITYTLFKNVASTELAVTATADNVVINGAAGSVSVLAGDKVAIQANQSTGSPVIFSTVAVRCQ